MSDSNSINYAVFNVNYIPKYRILNSALLDVDNYQFHQLSQYYYNVTKQSKYIENFAKIVLLLKLGTGIVLE